MANILNIESSGRKASICLASGEETKAFLLSENLKDHAAWLHPAIAEAMKQAGWNMEDLDAVAISEGPGSYTGLRMGMAAAKGICFARQIPLIGVSSLLLQAVAAREHIKTANFYVPMIDARRMEVYCAVYNNELEQLAAPAALVLNKDSLQEFRESGTLLICGDGAAKASDLFNDPKILLHTTEATAETMSKLSSERHRLKAFADLAYSEPFYLKEFYSQGK